MLKGTTRVATTYGFRVGRSISRAARKYSVNGTGLLRVRKGAFMREIEWYHGDNRHSSQASLGEWLFLLEKENENEREKS